jgi:hypothetical protein
MADPGRARVVLVSYLAGYPLTPRGARTQAVARALGRHADVRLIGGSGPSDHRNALTQVRDRVLSEFGSRWFVDRFEPWSWRTLARRRFDADVALLIGYPFSPLVVAASALRRAGIPYVVDMSDPWALATPGAPPAGFRERRSAELEVDLWRGAAAGIVTTTGQARNLQRLVPGLDLLVRPNGYSDCGPIPPRRRGHGDAELRIGHFGHLYAPRIDVRGFLGRLAASGRWTRVSFHQYGQDQNGSLRGLPDRVTVETHEPVPWPEVVRRAATDIDVAVVIGNNNSTQLPSKAVEYLTLPVPRLAITAPAARDALSEYVGTKPGWLTLAADDPDPATRVWNHVRREWAANELRPPAEESWERVAEHIAAFVLARLRAVPPGWRSAAGSENGAGERAGARDEVGHR